MEEEEEGGGGLSATAYPTHEIGNCFPYGIRGERDPTSLGTCQGRRALAWHGTIRLGELLAEKACTSPASITTTDTHIHTQRRCAGGRAVVCLSKIINS